MNAISSENAEEYSWGINCKAFDLLKSDSLSVKEELMPAGTSEQLHYHERMQQFFYILNGTATFIIDEIESRVSSNQGIHIKANSKHMILNKENIELRFLVISQPNVAGDRINL